MTLPVGLAPAQEGEAIGVAGPERLVVVDLDGLDLHVRVAGEHGDRSDRLPGRRA